MLKKQWQITTREGLIILLCSFNLVTWFTLGLIVTMRIALQKGWRGYVQAYGVMLIAAVFWAGMRFFSSLALVQMQAQVVVSALVFITGFSLVFIHHWRRIYTLTVLSVGLWSLLWLLASQWIGEMTAEQMQSLIPFFGGVSGAENIEQNREQLGWMMQQGGGASIFLWLGLGWLVAKHRSNTNYVLEVKSFKVPLGVHIFTVLLVFLGLAHFVLRYYGYQLNIGWLYFVGTNAGDIILRLYWLAGVGLILDFTDNKGMSYERQWLLLRFLVFLNFMPLVGIFSRIFLAMYAVSPIRHHRHA